MSSLNPHISTHTENKLDTPHSEYGMFLFLLFDMCIFGLYFWVFAADKSALPEQFALGQANLNTLYGSINTFALLLSSYFIARALLASRQNQKKSYQRHIALGISCGILFLIVKAIEYSEKFAQGLSINSSTFYRDYFCFTGFHMLHVIIGLSLLTFCLFESKQKAVSDNAFFEGCTLYWHMVDLLWLVLFALIYLAP